jgi:hypothetical protein
MKLPVRNRSLIISATKIVLLITVIFQLPLFLFGQQRDARLRTGVAFEKKLSKSTTLGVTLEQRFEQDMTAFDRFLAEPVVSYNLNKKWETSLSYRGWISPDEAGNQRYRHRSNFDLSYRYKHSLLTLKLTGGVQYGIPDLNFNQTILSGNLILRNSVRASYQIFGTRFSPFAKYELFTQAGLNEWMNYQYRTTFGTAIYITNHTGLVVYYAFEHEFNIKNRMDAHIWGVELKHEF